MVREEREQFIVRSSSRVSLTPDITDLRHRFSRREEPLIAFLSSLSSFLFLFLSSFFLHLRITRLSQFIGHL